MDVFWLVIRTANGMLVGVIITLLMVLPWVSDGQRPINMIGAAVGRWVGRCFAEVWWGLRWLLGSSIRAAWVRHRTRVDADWEQLVWFQCRLEYEMAQRSETWWMCTCGQHKDPSAALLRNPWLQERRIEKQKQAKKDI